MQPVWNGVATLRIEFSDGEGRSEASPSNGEGRSEASPSNGEGRSEASPSSSDVTAESVAEKVVLTVDGGEHELSRNEASQLAEAIGDALESREEFFRTAGKYRADGSYVVSRRAADSAGNEKVFDSFDRLERLYERLPDEFDADDVGRTGITGSRRHMVVRHVAEHPAFDCRTVSRNPLQVRKETAETAMEESEPAAAD